VLEEIRALASGAIEEDFTHNATGLQPGSTADMDHAARGFHEPRLANVMARLFLVDH
jgi:hypothetical protein